MPLLNGFHAIRRIKADRPETRVIFLTVHTEPAFVSEAKGLAALGYVIKQCIPSHLIPAIREALQNRPFVSTSISGSDPAAPNDSVINPEKILWKTRNPPS
jgi:DNA-binding NarL/FixJ family response regulator